MSSGCYQGCVFSSSQMKYRRTGDNVAGDGVSTVAAVENGLNAVGVLSSWEQTTNVNTPRVRGLFSRRFAFLTREHRKLRKKHCDQQILIKFSTVPKICSQLTETTC